MNGYAGKILYIDLTKKKISPIPTKKYESWIGGHGMGSALFFDLVKDKTIDGFHPDNAVTMMTSPLSGTIAPAASGRIEVQGIGVQSYPIGWFTRSNFGGRFAAMLKYAGWDGVAIQGKSSEPVWVDIRDDEVKIRSCTPLSLWGKDTWECQEIIWDNVAGKSEYMDRIEPGGDKDGSTTQRPAVVCIGPAGENMSIPACLIHDAGSAAGQGGFGAIWGSKNLKAVSVIGTGNILIHNPKALIEARLWHKKHYAFDLEKIKGKTFRPTFDSPPTPLTIYRRGKPSTDKRPQACVGCHSGCRARYEDGLGNESTCWNTIVYDSARSLDIQRQTSDLLNKYGLNAAEILWGERYLRDLNRYGILGPGKEIDCPLNFKNYGRFEYIEQLVKAIAYRNNGLGEPHPFGNDIAEGFVRAAEKWGRLKGDQGDIQTGRLPFPFWGLPLHSGMEPRSQLEWAYGTILGDRDICEHDFIMLKNNPFGSIENIVKIFTDKMEPFQGNMQMLDFSTENMYSENMAKLVSWHRYYTRCWKQSALYCNWRWPDFLNQYNSNLIGSTGIGEPKFLNAVTGKNLSFLDGIKLGRRIWNLDHSIWTLQGRHRDMVQFADYLYTQPGRGSDVYLPVLENGKWKYVNTISRHFDRDKFEEFKSRFYKLQGWETSTGYPLESTLKSQGLDFVANELKKNGTLGQS